MLRAFADHIEFAFKRVGIDDCRAAADQHLLERRFTGLRRGPNRAVIDRHRAPAQQGLPFFGDDAREGLSTERGFGGAVR